MWRCIARQDQLKRKFTRLDISDFVVNALKTDKEISQAYINCSVEYKYNNVAQLISNVRSKLWNENENIF